MNPHGLRQKNMCDCFKLNLGSFCHFTEEQTIRGQEAIVSRFADELAASLREPGVAKQL